MIKISIFLCSLIWTYNIPKVSHCKMRCKHYISSVKQRYIDYHNFFNISYHFRQPSNKNRNKFCRFDKTPPHTNIHSTSIHFISFIKESQKSHFQLNVLHIHYNSMITSWHYFWENFMTISNESLLTSKMNSKHSCCQTFPHWK